MEPASATEVYSPSHKFYRIASVFKSSGQLFVRGSVMVARVTAHIVLCIRCSRLNQPPLVSQAERLPDRPRRRTGARRGVATLHISASSRVSGGCVFVVADVCPKVLCLYSTVWRETIWRMPARKPWRRRCPAVPACESCGMSSACVLTRVNAKLVSGQRGWALQPKYRCVFVSSCVSCVHQAGKQWHFSGRRARPGSGCRVVRRPRIPRVSV